MVLQDAFDGLTTFGDGPDVTHSQPAPGEDRLPAQDIGARDELPLPSSKALTLDSTSRTTVPIWSVSTVVSGTASGCAPWARALRTAFRSRLRSTTPSSNSICFRVSRYTSAESESLGLVLLASRPCSNSLRTCRSGKFAPRLPTVDEILERVLDVEARISDDPTTAREAIRRMLLDGKIVMQPEPDSSYRAESVIFPLRLPKSRKPRNPKGSEASHDVVGNDGCAGAICALEHMVSVQISWDVRRAA